MPLSIRRTGEITEDLSVDEARVITAFEEHLALMLKDEWYITVDFARVDGECMETEAFPEYRKATISVDLQGISEQWEYLNHYIRHELTHVLLWEFFSIAGELCYKRAKGVLTKLEESTVYIIEHMPLWEIVYGKK